MLYDTVGASACQSHTQAPVDYSLDRRYSTALLAPGYTVIPNDALCYYGRLGVTSAEWTLICHLCSYRWSDADPFPSDATLAARMGLVLRKLL